MAAQSRGEAVDILGDACDPVPCPQTLPQAKSPGVPVCAPNPPPNQNTQQCVQRSVQNSTVMNPIGSHPKDAYRTGAEPDNVVTVPAASGATEARFCESVGFSDCNSAQVVDSRQLNFYASADVEVGSDPGHPWHRMTLGPLQLFPLNGLTGAARGASESVDYGPATRLGDVWNYANDWSYWTTGGHINLPSDYPACQSTPFNGLPNSPGTCAHGTLWRHSDSPVGFTTSTVNGVNVGLHASVPSVADFYTSISADQALSYCPTATDRFNLGGTPPLAAIQAPIVFWPHLTAFPTRAFDTKVAPATEVILPLKIQGLASLQDDGTGIIVGGASTPCTTNAISVPFASQFVHLPHWTNFAEPSAFRSTLVPSNMIAVAMDAHGVTMQDAAVVSPTGVLQTATELANQEGAIGGVEVGLPGVVAPAARVGFVPVFSRAAGGVFELGGRDATSNALLSDIWFLPYGGHWKRVLFDGSAYVPGTVVAATYAFADRRLWVLDYFVNAANVQTARIARIDPVSGVVDVFSTWPRLNLLDRWFMSLDRDGSVLVSGSSGAYYVVVRLEITPTVPHVPYAAAILVQPGALAMAPIVDENNYAFVTWNLLGQIGIRRRPTFDLGLTDKDCTETLLPALSAIGALF